MPANRWRSLFGRLTAYLGEHEKVLLALLSVVIVISGSFWLHQFSSTHGDQPSPGGTFVEGVVGSQKQIEDEAARLTKAGLFSFDKNGQLTKQLVSDWTANGDQTEYRFSLVPNVPLNEIQGELAADNTLLGPAIVSNDKNQLVITLQTSDPALPLLLAQPLFNFGPYKISKMSTGTAILVRNTRTRAVNPYINRVIINAYPTEQNLLEALKKQKIDGAQLVSATSVPGYQTKTFNLPLYYTVFFNLNRTPFRDQRFGQAVSAGQSIPAQAFTLTAASSQPYATLAQDLVNRWQAAGAKVTLELKSEAEIKEQIAPSRDFQALFSGVDYGYELDPYYLWNSTQIRPPGNNLAGVKDDQIDGLITQIRQATNMNSRKSLIGTLHQALQSQGVAEVVGQEKVVYLVADTIRSIDPWTPDVAADWLQSLALWSVK